MEYYSDIPCGMSLPINNIHAVSVSMPRLSDVIGYENKDPEVLKKVRSGYPRFVIHPYLVHIQKHLEKKFNVHKNIEILLVSSHNAVSRVFEFTGQQYEIISDKGITGICIPKESEEIKNARLFLQHTGLIPSSRLAEKYLLGEGAIEEQYRETLYTEGPAVEKIKETLVQAYEIDDNKDVLLCNSGMSALYAVYRALGTIHNNSVKNSVIQFGWLYLDTMEILKKFGSHSIFIDSIVSTKNLEHQIGKNKSRVSAIFTEVTTNPLVQTPDIFALKKMTRQHDIPLIVDATLGTPYNVDVLSHADVVIESLTKFASGSGDVMMGALILNKNSPWYNDIRRAILPNIETPFEGDMQRLAVEIDGYKERINRVNENTMALVEYFQRSKKVKELYWPYQELTKENYEAIQRRADSPGGVISLVFDEPFAKIYDRIMLSKGPSFGTEFSLLMPYMYLAHYDLVSTKEGRDYLKSVGISPDLLRVSVGINDCDKVIRAFEKALT